MFEQSNENLSSEQATPLIDEQGEKNPSAQEVKAEEVRPAFEQAPKSFAWLIQSVVKSGIFVASGILVIALLGFAQKAGWISAGGGGGDHEQSVSVSSNTKYICPMICVPPSPLPGNCPTCGMKLVASSSNSGGEDGLSVEFSPATRRVANIQTAPVLLMGVERSIHTIGKIALDESRKATISSYVDGRIEKLFADYTGVDVSTGDHMVILYSPQLYGAQVEYLVSKESNMKNNLSSNGNILSLSLLENAKEKLKELGMTEEQIVQLEKRKKAETRLRICAPAGGTVIKKMRDEGDYVKEGTPIYQIADLSVVWLMLELFPEDAAQIRYGQNVEVSVQSLPTELFTGRVAFIDPVVSEKTRTVNVRVEMLNYDRRLRPGDYATATVKIPIASQGEVYDAEMAGKWISPRHPQIVRDQPGRCPLCEKDLVPTSDFGYIKNPSKDHVALVVPRDALLMAGDHTVVYVETEPGHFEIRPVTLGALTDKNAVILSGLKKGEQVATSGNFLIDSQMQLAGNPSLIDPTRAIEALAKRDRKQLGQMEQSEQNNIKKTAFAGSNKQ